MPVYVNGAEQRNISQLSDGDEIIRGYNLKWDGFAIFDFSSLETYTSNTGTVAKKAHQLNLNSGATADSKAAAYSVLTNYISSGHLPFAMQDFDVDTEIGWVIGLEDDVATGKGYLLYGPTVTVIDPSVRGFGFRIDNKAVKGLVHDDASLHVIDLSTTLSIASIYRLSLVFDSGNKIEWFINDVSKGSSTQIPSGNTKSTPADFGKLSAQVTNGGTGTSYVFDCFKMTFKQEIW